VRRTAEVAEGAGAFISPEAVRVALQDVMDPELPISIVDMGLVYDVRVSGSRVEVDLSFTATACPCIDFIETDVRERLLREPGVAEVAIRRVWDPPWTKARISERGRALLRQAGVAL
jgi:metal-sulfur cluster biosynthetic enzyme